MKKFIPLLAIVFVSFTVVSQDNFETDNKNELGLDLTGFIRFYTQFQQSNDFVYDPTYYLTYRRYFSTGNIRFGIGGDYNRFEVSSPLTDSVTFYNTESAITMRIGWEWKTELSKRWQAFYGADFRYIHSSGDIEANFFNGGYAVGIEYKGTTLGLSPIIGFRFRLNDRISLITEASLSIYHLTYDQLDKSTPITTGLPEQDDVIQPTTKSVYMSFQQPISVFFVFNL